MSAMTTAGPGHNIGRRREEYFGAIRAFLTADDLASANLEIDVIDRDLGAVTLGQPLCPDDDVVNHAARP